MPKIFNLTDFVKISVIAFLFIWAANRALDKIGMAEYKV